MHGVCCDGQHANLVLSSVEHSNNKRKQRARTNIVVGRVGSTVERHRRRLRWIEQDAHRVHSELARPERALRLLPARLFQRRQVVQTAHQLGLRVLHQPECANPRVSLALHRRQAQEGRQGSHRTGDRLRT